MSEALGSFLRSGYCAQYGIGDVGKEISVCGFVQRSRNLGGLIFIDLRDRSGILQCIFDSSDKKELFDRAFKLRSEYVIGVTGVLRPRGETAVNNNLKTGEIELVATGLKVFSEAQTPPFEIVENSSVNEQLRMKYRYLDLRRSDMQKMIALRHRVLQAVRRYFDSQGFYEIETPILTKSTPEGARDYLVPSRVHQGKFYSLPQSPQQYKQLLMLAGFDRYMQIVKCFRDEDLRADRQPEFTQIDLEMAFVDVDQVIKINEGFLYYIFKEILDIEIELPIMRITYKEARERFGSDKPDLRFGFELTDLTGLLEKTEFKVFAGAVAGGGRVMAIKVDKAARFTRKEIDSLTEFAKTYRAKGLAWAKTLNGETSSSYMKFLSEKENREVFECTGMGDGDLLLIVADSDKDVVMDALGALRIECARRLDVIDKNSYKLTWVVDFPLFEYSEEDGRYVAMHHPFTSPADGDEERLLTDPANVTAKAYDIICNGYELGGGSIRIHSNEVQARMFEALGFTPESAEDRFGYFLEAFRYGAPPHGGIAYGFDRLIMILAKTDNIKDVIAFPKMQNASEPMTNSPDVVEKKQLEELAIALIKTEE